MGCSVEQFLTDLAASLAAEPAENRYIPLLAIFYVLLRGAAEFPEDAFTALRNVLELLYTNHFRACLPAMSEAAVFADAQGADIQTRALLEEVGLASAVHRRC